MNPEPSPSMIRIARAEEINRLHAEAVRLTRESRDVLHAGLVAAWRAGQLLVQEKRHVRQNLGRGAWQLWLERSFSGSPRTAQRYMMLARTIPDVSAIRDLSLRQVYFRLGIATEPKGESSDPGIPQLPKHTSLAMRLLGALGTGTAKLPPDLQSAYRQDLRPLYERLRTLFEPRSSEGRSTAGQA